MRKINLIPEIQIPRVHLIEHIGYIVVIPVSEDYIAHLFEFIQIADNAAIEEALLFHSRLVDHDLNSLCLDALHDALNGGLAEVVASCFHGQAIHTDNFRIPRDDLICNEILMCAICRNNSRNKLQMTSMYSANLVTSAILLQPNSIIAKISIQINSTI